MRTIFVLTLALCFSAFTPTAKAGDIGQGQGKGQGQSQGKNQGYNQGQQGQGYGQGQPDYDTETHATCREGSEETFLEDVGNGGEGMQPVRYVCRSGRFVKVFKDARDYGPRERHIYTCREGSEEIFNEDVYGTGEGTYPVRYVCHNGRFVKVFKDARDYGPRERHIYSCREGSEETFLEQRGSGDEGSYPVRYVCHNGRFVKLYR